MGKFFIKPFCTKTQGCFLQYPCYPRSVPSQRLLLPFSCCVLRPPKGCLTQQSTSLVVFWRLWGWGSEFKVSVPFSCELFLVHLGKVAGNRLLLNLWLRSSSQERQEPPRALFFFLTYTNHWPGSWWQLLKSQIVLFGLCKSKCETWEQRTSTERYENVTGSVLPKEETSKPKKE